jgi:uncharacterized protein (DUF433 family)
MAQRKTHSTLPDFIISRDPEVMGGTPVFAGTRVPVKTFTDYLSGGYSIKEFTKDFPRVEHEQIIELLRRISELLEEARI